MSDVLSQFHESMARRDDSYHHWTAPDFLAIAKKAMEIGEKNLLTRMYRGMDKEGREEIFFRLYDMSKCTDLESAVEGDGVWTFNVSHLCPPWCGGG